MTKTVKNQLLRNLYNLKSFGYEYHETLDFFSSEVKNFKLPNNLDALKNSVEHCYLCELCKSRKNVLFGYGNANSDIMFISDEPSNSEDEMGAFYSGKSGELLTKMIENVLNIQKEEVYLTTLVKCKSLNGLNNLSGNSVDGNDNNGGDGIDNLPNKFVKSALKYRAYSPLVDNILSNFNINNVNSLVDGSYLNNMLNVKNDTNENDVEIV